MAKRADAQERSKMYIISTVEELEFAIETSRNTTSITQVYCADLDASIQYLKDRYDVGEESGDVWATEGDWRLQLYQDERLSKINYPEHD